MGEEEEGREHRGLLAEQGAGGDAPGWEEGVEIEGVARSTRAVARVGPSIVCAAAAECGAFLLGATTGMPAVISFSRFAAIAVAVDVVIQLTLFPAMLSLTFGMRSRSGVAPASGGVEHATERAAAAEDGEPAAEAVHRRGVAEIGDGPGLRGSGGRAAGDEAQHARGQRGRGQGQAAEGLEERLLDSVSPDLEIEEEEIQRVENEGGGEPEAGVGEGGMDSEGVEHSFSPRAEGGMMAAGRRGTRERGGRWRMNWEARVMSSDGKVWVLIMAIAVMVWSLLASSRVERGLEQTDALPSDSFLISYFRDLAALVQVGPPVFFVVTGAGEGAGQGGAARAGEPCNFSEPADLKKLCTRRGCRDDSLGNAVSNAARFTNYTFIATGASNVADDVISWLTASRNDATHACCRRALAPAGDAGPFCPPRWNPLLHPGQALPEACTCNSSLTFRSAACPSAPAAPCPVAGGCLAPGLPDRAFQRYNATSGAGRCWGVRLATLCPEGGEQPFCDKECYAKFSRTQQLAPCLAPSAAFPSAADLRAFFGDFLNSECPSDPSDAACATCGMHYRADLSNLSLAALALRGSAVTPAMATAQTDPAAIRAARFMSYHSPLRSQADFISALEYAYAMADDLSERLALEIVPYSVYYVFFEQYVQIEEAAMRVSALALVAVAGVVCWLLGSIAGALLVLATALAIEVSLIGAMGVWAIKLNALSTVNLVAAIGISVEFSVHIVHAFTHAQGSREARALGAMRGVGNAVVSGIAVTKFLGVCACSFDMLLSLLPSLPPPSSPPPHLTLSLSCARARSRSLSLALSPFHALSLPFTRSLSPFHSLSLSLSLALALLGYAPFGLGGCLCVCVAVCASACVSELLS